MTSSPQDRLPAKSGSTLIAVLALLSAICFAVLVYMQVTEYLGYAKDPSLWPPG